MRRAAFAVARRVGAAGGAQGLRAISRPTRWRCWRRFADSALDLFTSTLNLVAIRSALTPADAEHRFGHGKAEPLAGLAQGAFIAGSAMFLVIQAINRFVAPRAGRRMDARRWS